MKRGSDTHRPLFGLAGGVVATILLVLVASIVTVQHVERARQHAQRVAESAERAGLLVSQIDQIEWLLTNMRVLALQAITSPESAPVAYAQKRFIDRELLVRVERLGPFLVGRERRKWSELRPDLYELRAVMAELHIAIEHEDDVEASRIMSQEVNPRVTQLDSALAGLKEVHIEERAALVQRLEDHLSNVWLTIIVTNGALVLALCGVWLVVARLVHRKQRLVDEYTQRVEDANEELDAFAGRVAHDLLNGLTPINTAAAILSREDSLSPRGKEAAERLGRSVMRTRNLLRGLLAFARAGQAEEGGRSRIAEVCTAVIEEQHDRATRVDAQVECRVDDVEVRVPEGLLHSVLSNLLSNALKFVNGRPERKVTIASRPNAHDLELIISDTGPGVTPEVAARIFEPFYREPGVRAEGHGLGLATVRRIVESHGGRVAVVSRPGSGATFKVTLPLAS